MTPKQADKLIAAWQGYSDEEIKTVVNDAINMDVRDALAARAEVLDNDAREWEKVSAPPWPEAATSFRERARVLRAMADRLAEAEG